MPGVSHEDYGGAVSVWCERPRVTVRVDRPEVTSGGGYVEAGRDIFIDVITEDEEQ